MTETWEEQYRNAGQPAFGGGGDDQGGPGGTGSGEGERRALQRFLQTLDADLLDMLADDDFLTPETSGFARTAYQAARADIATMIDLLNDPRREPALAEHGLLGPQLRFKMAVHGRARQLYLAPPIVVPVGVPDTDGTLAADQAAEEYLKCSDIILESLSGALGGAGAAVIEIKKIIEWLKGVAARFRIRF